MGGSDAAAGLHRDTNGVGHGHDQIPIDRRTTASGVEINHVQTACALAHKLASQEQGIAVALLSIEVTLYQTHRSPTAQVDGR